MKPQKENTTRFKETILLLSFLILLFSFSNKSFGISKNTEERKSNSTSIIKEVSAIVFGNSNLNSSFKKQISSSNDPQNNFVVFNANTESKNFISKVKNTLRIKPPNISRLYYLYFSLNSDETPSLA